MKWWVLLVLASVNLLNYVDRYIFSALLPSIKSDLHFTDTELGLLGSGFILAYLFISPIFGYLGDRTRRPRLMGVGLALWSAATAFSGMSFTFVTQMITRVMVGVGESAYTVVAPSVLADSYPKKVRGKVFSIYSGAIPVGSAFGFILGGWLGKTVGWHKAFFVVGIPGIVLALVLLFMRDPKRGSQEESPAAPGAATRVGSSGTKAVAAPLSQWQTYRKLSRNGGLLFTILGYAAYTFVVGGMGFWMPSFIVRYFSVSLERGNYVFGAVTVVGGFIGTMLGGWWADRIDRRSGNGYLKICAGSMILAVPIFYVSLSVHAFKDFAIALFFMDIVLFMCMSPLDAAVINYVRPELRSTAMAMNVFLIHFLGDGISRVLMGVVSDHYGLHAALAFLPWVLALAGVLWGIGLIAYWQPLAWPVAGMEFPQHQAHRGSRMSTGIIENTLDAFREAKVRGAEMVECDVQRSRDGVIVIYHDGDLKRLSNRDEKVSELSLSELRKYAGVCTLRELLEDGNCPQKINIELKTASVRNDGLERDVVAVVHEAQAQGRVLFSSFNPFSLGRLARHAPEIPRALLVSHRDEPKNKIYLKKMWLGVFAQPHLIHIDDEMANEESMQSWLERNIPVAVWTVNDRERAQQLFDLGARSVISDTLL